MIDTLILIFSVIFTLIKYSIGIGIMVLLTYAFLKQHAEDNKKQIKRPF